MSRWTRRARTLDAGLYLDRRHGAHGAENGRAQADDRPPFTEKPVKAEASRCLGCEATVVDQNRCVGCGICTSRCKFNASHLLRNPPEFVNYVSGDDSKKVIQAMFEAIYDRMERRLIP